MEFIKKDAPKIEDAVHLHYKFFKGEISSECRYLLIPIDDHKSRPLCYDDHVFLSLGHIISYLRKARQKGSNICIHISPTIRVECANIKSDTVVYSLFQTEEEWFVALTGLSKTEYYKKYTLREKDEDTHSYHVSSAKKMADETFNFYVHKGRGNAAARRLHKTDHFYTTKKYRYDDSDSYVTFYQIYQILKQAKKENRNILVNVWIDDDMYPHEYSSQSSEKFWFAYLDFSKTESYHAHLADQKERRIAESKQAEEQRVIAERAEKSKMLLAQKQAETQAIFEKGKSLVPAQLESLWGDFIASYSYYDAQGTISEVQPIVISLVACLEMVEKGVSIDEIKEIIKTNESLAGLILQFSKKGPEFARAFRGEFLTPEDETLIREIEERNKTFTDTLSESALDVKPNELRRMLIKKLKHSDESGSMSV